MKKKLFLVLIVILKNPVFAQEHSIDLNNLDKNIDSTYVLLAKLKQKFAVQLARDTNGILAPYVYNQYIDSKFTYLSYQRGTLPTGNSAALDLSEDESKLKLSLARKVTNKQGKPILIATTGIQSKLNDGIADLFKKNNITGGTKLFLNFAWLRNKFAFKTVTDQYKNGQALSTPFGKKLPKIINYNKDFNDRYDYSYKIKYKKLAGCLKAIKQELETESSCKSYSELIAEKELIEKQLEEAGYLDKEPEDIAKEIESDYKKGFYELMTNKPAWEWFKLCWLDGGFIYSRDSYFTYDSNLVINKRFGTKTYDTWGFRIAANYFTEKEHENGVLRALYANISYEPFMVNNYSDLDDETIIKTIQSTIIQDTSITFQTSKSAKNITNIPYSSGIQHNISIAFTAMFLKQKSLGVNLLGQAQISPQNDMIFNARVGLLVSLPNSNYDPSDKDSKSKVNFEIFIQLPDLMDLNGTNKTFMQRSVIGLSTNIPFRKIFL